MANDELSKRIHTALILIPLVAGAVMLGGAWFFCFILMTMGAMLYEWHMLMIPRIRERFSRHHLWIAPLGSFYIAAGCAAMIGVRSIPEAGLYLTIFTALCVIATDVGAYFGGKRFGRHKLAPRISPSKTWEGLACGACASACMAIVSLPLLGFSTPQSALYGVFFALIGQAGDLLESLMKRAAGVKDSSQLLPGHGGVLDRCDSHLTAFLASILMFG